MNNINSPKQFDKMDKEKQENLLTWIKTSWTENNRKYKASSSYGLKHEYEEATGIYVTNGEFKGAMVAAGFRVANPIELNWHFFIKPLK